MIQHPTIVHWAADHHRKGLLADVVSDRSTTPVSGRKTISPCVARIGLTSLAAAVSRIVDEFEPHPGSRAASAGRRQAQTQS
jgi:hypothetical protein